MEGGRKVGGESEIAVLEHRVSAVEETMRDAIGEIRDGISEIAANTGKLAILEERHAETRDGLVRAFNAIGSLDSGKSDRSSVVEIEKRVRDIEGRVPERLSDRLMSIEVSMPALKETRRWVVAGVLAVCSVVGMAVIAIAMVGPK